MNCRTTGELARRRRQVVREDHTHGGAAVAGGRTRAGDEANGGFGQAELGRT
jgi:hypothetical protein